MQSLAYQEVTSVTSAEHKVIILKALVAPWGHSLPARQLR
jgi:hypothetical protein